MNEDYQAFLLSLQRGQGSGRWRARLENVHTGELLHFSTERELLGYLRRVLADKEPGTISVVEDLKRSKG